MAGQREHSLLKLQPIVLATLVLAACSFGNLHDDLDYFEVLGTVEVVVAVESWSGAPIIVAAIAPPQQEGTRYNIVRVRTLSEPGALRFMLEPGSYVLAALEDSNRNGEVDDGERGVVSPTIEISEGHDQSVVMRQELLVTAELQRAPTETRPLTLDSDDTFASGEQVRLDEDRFGADVAQLGLWEPYTFLREYRSGIYMLEPYDPDRTPVIFVHGMTGFPQEFSHIIEGLDRSRFQPWFLHYPSGAQLQEMARVFSQLVTALQSRHEFEGHCVVAHSMGGLLSWAYLNEQFQEGAHSTARGLVSIASPFGGMPSASWGVRMAPSVVPAWRDISPNSDFLEALFTGPTPPDDFEYHLLFMWQDDAEDDGTVALPSQLRYEAQSRATYIRGFEESHGGCLGSDDVRAQVYIALDRCRDSIEASTNEAVPSQATVAAPSQASDAAAPSETAPE